MESNHRPTVELSYSETLNFITVSFAIALPTELHPRYCVEVWQGCFIPAFYVQLENCLMFSRENFRQCPQDFASGIEPYLFRQLRLIPPHTFNTIIFNELCFIPKGRYLQIREYFTLGTRYRVLPIRFIHQGNIPQNSG